MEPRRLLEEDDDRFELRLLRSACSDRAPAGARERAAVALGLSASGLVATSAAHGATAASKATLAVLAKWFGVGLVSGAVVTGGLHYAATPARPTKHAAVSPNITQVAHVPAKAIAPATSAQSTTPAEETVADVPTKKLVTTKHAEPAPAISIAPVVETPPAPQTDSLAAELALLGTARRALVARDPAAVLAALAAYDAAPRTGVLDAEANMLRVEAWLQQGERARAVELARRLLSASPGSTHAARLRHVVEGTP
jgi:hypothetical protein